jgi:hypothetical protein
MSSTMKTLALGGLAWTLGLMTGCVQLYGEPRQSVEDMKKLSDSDPTLAAKLELDSTTRENWWTAPGRWDDPSRRIRIDWGPLALVGMIAHPSSFLELPVALISLFTPPRRESEKDAQLRRLAEEAAERAFPLYGRPSK